MKTGADVRSETCTPEAHHIGYIASSGIAGQCWE